MSYELMNSTRNALEKAVVKGYPNECAGIRKLINDFKEACELYGMEQELRSRQ